MTIISTYLIALHITVMHSECKMWII